MNTREQMHKELDILLTAMERYEGPVTPKSYIYLKVQSTKVMDESFLDVTYCTEFWVDYAEQLCFESREMLNLQSDLDEDDNVFKHCAEELWMLDEEGDMVAAI